VIASTLEPYRGDVAQIKEVFAEYPSGLAAIGARVDGDEVLMIASSFTVGVSFDPPMCSVAIQNSSVTWPRIARSARIGVSSLGADHALAVWQLASRNRDHRLDGLSKATSEAGGIYLHGATAWIECEVAGEYEAGDHTIVLLEVRSTHIVPDSAPLILHRGRVFEPVAAH
jgi:flavin reductase (DIM6/NTAB) family NADH-FMN oxidoreductase RutF